ncbi:CopD family protein [Glycomyces endophyticus]|uniref:CopD family protein n=1 Tax=Glycomyces endophyticus TaxID=480996 RepID=A0ABP4TV58_9ACTN
MTALRTRPPGRAALLALAVLLALAPARAASAHAALLSTDPADGAALDAAPDTVTLAFNESVRPVDDAMRLIDSAGGDHDVDAAARDRDVVLDLPDDLPDGAYHLNWRVISADDHPIAGVLAFTVGDAQPGTAPAPTETPDEIPAPVPAAAAALHYLGLLLFAGYLCFRTAIARGAWPARPRGRLLRTAATAAIIGAALAVPLGGLEIAGLPLSGLADVGAWTASATTASLIVLAATAIGVGGAYAIRERHPRAAPALAAATVAAPALAGHSLSFGVQWIMIGADAIHLATGAFWAGGLAGLLVMLRHRTGDPARAALVVSRFSACAAYSVALLGTSGLVMALSIHRDWDAFAASDHGRALIVKLSLVALALALAGWNRFRLIPVVAASAAAGLSRLRRVLAAEAAIVAAAVVLTGVLVNASPAAPVQEPAPEPLPTGGVVSAEGALGDGAFEAHLSPGLTGENMLMLALTDAAGAPLVPLEPPVVTAVLPAEDFGPVAAEIHEFAPGQYHCAMDLPLPGTWEVTVQARATEFDAVTATITVDIGSSTPD